MFIQVGKCIQLVSTFFGGFIIAFIKGWLLTLVMLSSLPLLVISGGITSIVITKMTSRGQSAYAKAADVVEQTISSIRTVCYIFSKQHSFLSLDYLFLMKVDSKYSIAL